MEKGWFYLEKLRIIVEYGVCCNGKLEGAGRGGIWNVEIHVSICQLWFCPFKRCKTSSSHWACTTDGGLCLWYWSFSKLETV